MGGARGRSDAGLRARRRVGRARRTRTLAAAKAEAKALNAFGIALYRRMLEDPAIAPPGKGVVFSPDEHRDGPRDGARGRRRARPPTRWTRSCASTAGRSSAAGLNSLDALLRSRDAAWKDQYEEGDPHQLALRTANMAFGQEGYALEDAYLERLGRTFGSGLGLVDYINETDAARKAINGWVSRQTMGRIPELLGLPDVTVDTRLVLVNAIYLKAEWARSFDEDQTTPRTFTTALGDAIKVPTMRAWGEQDIVLASGDGWKATELALPRPGRHDAARDDADPARRPGLVRGASCPPNGSPRSRRRSGRSRSGS